MIERNRKRPSVLGYTRVNCFIIEVYALDFYVNKASLSDPVEKKLVITQLSYSVKSHFFKLGF